MSQTREELEAAGAVDPNPTVDTDSIEREIARLADDGCPNHPEPDSQIPEPRLSDEQPMVFFARPMILADAALVTIDVRRHDTHALVALDPEGKLDFAEAGYPVSAEELDDIGDVFKRAATSLRGTRPRES